VRFALPHTEKSSVARTASNVAYAQTFINPIAALNLEHFVWGEPCQLIFIFLFAGTVGGV
jgi:hypothetical protein